MWGFPAGQLGAGFVTVGKSLHLSGSAFPGACQQSQRAARTYTGARGLVIGVNTGASRIPGGSVVKNPPAKQEMRV